MCVVVGKNYRLQDIQLSKNLFGVADGGAKNLLTARRPAASSVSWAPVQERAQEKHGGEYRARTGDLLVANQALSQLS